MYSCWQDGMITGVDRPSAGALEAGQDQQGPQQRGGVRRAHADLGQHAPGLERGEAVFALTPRRGLSRGDAPNGIGDLAEVTGHDIAGLG